MQHALTSEHSNELNAAYAADGYARVSETIGVVLTTFVLQFRHFFPQDL